MRDAQLVHQVGQDPHLARVGVVARGVGPRQAETRQVEADHPKAGRQRLGPRLPCVETGAETVQQDDRGRAARAGVAQAQANAVHPAVLARIGRFQDPARLVRRVQPKRRPRRSPARPGRPPRKGSSSSSFVRPKRLLVRARMPGHEHPTISLSDAPAATKPPPAARPGPPDLRRHWRAQRPRPKLSSAPVGGEHFNCHGCCSHWALSRRCGPFRLRPVPAIRRAPTVET